MQTRFALLLSKQPAAIPSFPIASVPWLATPEPEREKTADAARAALAGLRVAALKLPRCSLASSLRARALFGRACGTALLTMEGEGQTGRTSRSVPARNDVVQKCHTSTCRRARRSGCRCLPFVPAAPDVCAVAESSIPPQRAAPLWAEARVAGACVQSFDFNASWTRWKFTNRITGISYLVQKQSWHMYRCTRFDRRRSIRSYSWQSPN